MIISEQNSLFLFIDVQEKLVQMLSKDKARQKASILAQAATLMGVECVVTEQYPKGLGFTVDEVKTNLPDSTKFFVKTNFNALADTEIFDAIKGKENIFICGIETHICVLQTVCALLKNSFNVHVVKDACASRNTDEYDAAIKLMEKAGAKIVTTEITLFELLKSSKHPMFKQVQGLIK